HAVTDVETAHLGTHADHLPHILVPHVHTDRNRLARPLVPLPDVDVGAADGGSADLDQQVVMADLRFLGPLQNQSGPGFGLHQRSHRFRSFVVSRPLHGAMRCSLQASTPSSRPTALKAATARSMCSGVCAALICVRMRALPFGTTGNEKPTK